VKNQRGRTLRASSSGPSPGKNDEYSLLTSARCHSGRSSMLFRQDPPWEARDLTVPSRRNEIVTRRECGYAATRFTKNLCNIERLHRSSQFGMDARPNPVLRRFRLRRRPLQCLSGLGILLINCVQNHCIRSKGLAWSLSPSVKRHFDEPIVGLGRDLREIVLSREPG
jgi:hypothetical protein